LKILPFLVTTTVYTLDRLVDLWHDLRATEPIVLGVTVGTTS
jgi:hypothetical protein